MENEEMQNEKMSKENRSRGISAVNSKWAWVILVIIILLIVLGAGWFIIKQSEMLTSEIESGLLDRNGQATSKVLKEMGETMEKLVDVIEEMKKNGEAMEDKKLSLVEGYRESTFEHGASTSFQYPEGWHMLIEELSLSVTPEAPEPWGLNAKWTIDPEPIILWGVTEGPFDAEIIAGLVRDADLTTILDFYEERFGQSPNVSVTSAGVKVHQFVGEQSFYGETKATQNVSVLEVNNDEETAYYTVTTYDFPVSAEGQYEETLKAIENLIQTINTK